MTSTITRKLMVLLLLPVAGTAVSLIYFYFQLGETAITASAINLAGRQRMLAQEMRFYAHLMAHNGDGSVDAALRADVERFERTLLFLESGGDGENTALARALPTVRPQLDDMRKAWEAFKQPLLLVAAGTGKGERNADNYRSVEQRLPELAAATERLVTVYLTYTETEGRRALLALIAVTALNLVLLTAGIGGARRFVVRPLKELNRATRSVEAGDFGQRIAVETRDELGELAASFNRMAAVLERSEAARALGSARFAGVLDIAEEAIISIDAGQRIVLFNHGAERAFDYRAAEMIGQPLDLLLPARHRALHHEHVRRFAAAPDPTRLMTTRGTILGRRKDGSEFPAEASVSKIDVKGELLFTVLLRDISERVRANETQARLSAILEATTDFVGTADAAGRVLFINRAGRRMLGLAEDADLSHTGIAAHHPDWAARLILEQGLPTAARAGTWSGETALRAVDGNEIPVSQVIVAHRGGDGAIDFYSTVARDMSQVRRTEHELRARNTELQEATHRLQEAHAQLLQSEKLAAIGQLAAGVAHEINNPVGYINSNLGTLRRYLDDIFKLVDAYAVLESPLPAAENNLAEIAAMKDHIDIEFIRRDLPNLVQESLQGVDRVRRIVQDLKDFSRLDATEWQRVNLHQGLDTTLNIVHNEIKYRAEIVKDYGDLPPVECMPSQLNQVFMNLLVNAAQAIAERGTITLRSRAAGPDWVWIEIADTGHGIAPEHLARIFDPFFTTKPVGKGTGLGLSISYGIVAKHHGRIEVDSRPGKGTCFRVWLPIAQPQADHPLPAAVDSNH